MLRCWNQLFFKVIVEKGVGRTLNWIERGKGTTDYLKNPGKEQRKTRGIFPTLRGQILGPFQSTHLQ